jgi:hypothetical protein
MIELKEHEYNLLKSHDFFNIFNKLLPQGEVHAGKAFRDGNELRIIFTHPVICKLFQNYAHKPSDFNFSDSVNETLFEICYRNGFFKSKQSSTQ